MRKLERSWRPTRTRRFTISAVVIGCSLLASCSKPDAGLQQTTTAAQEAQSPSAVTILESTARPDDRVVLDDGRLVIHGLPAGFKLRDPGDKFTGIDDDLINTFSFQKLAALFVVAVHRGPRVAGELSRTTVTPSQLAGPGGQKLYLEGLPAARSRAIGWLVNPTTVAWVTSSNLSADELTTIARMIEVLS